MRRVNLRLPICVVIATLFAATTAQSQNTGYWRWFKTESGIHNGFGSAIHDSAAGGETLLTITDTAPGTSGVFAVTFSWYTPPIVLIPGSYLDWRVSGRVEQNSSPAALVHGTGDSIQLLTDYCSFDSDPTDYYCHEAGPGGVYLSQAPGASGNDPAGTVRTSSNLQQPTHTSGLSLYPPQAIPGNNSAGLLTFEVYAQVSYGRVWIWHYQYQWVVGSTGSCNGNCTLGSPGQTIGGNGGPGSVSVTATSTWDVIAVDPWITITSPTPGNGNSNVTFTVSPNTGPARIGTVLIGGQPYSISQDAAPAPLGPMARSGVLSHFAAGGGWTTDITLINTSTTAVSVQVVLHGDDGSTLSLPVTTTQQGATQTTTAASVNAVINPNATLLISTGDKVSSTAVGWADVLSSGPISGYAIFRSTPAKGSPSEGTVPLQSQFPAFVMIPYENSGGFLTGVAIANLSTAAANITATIWDDAGHQLDSKTIAVAASGHTSFVLPNTLVLCSGRRGIVKFQSSGGLAGLGLRFSPLGSFTSVPTM